MPIQKTLIDDDGKTWTVAADSDKVTIHRSGHQPATFDPETAAELAKELALAAQEVADKSTNIT